jgi:hypothetical protein
MLKGSATIEDLHRSWSFSTSIKNIAFAGKYFNIIALAALTTKLTIIDSTLMQKAFSTYVGTDVPVNVTNIIGPVNETIPITSTSTSGRSFQVLGMAKALTLEMQAWSQEGSVYQSPFHNCEGTCHLNLPAAGFEIDCSPPVVTEIDNGKTTINALSLELDIRGIKDNSRPVGITPLSGDLAFISGKNGSGEDTYLTANDTASLARAQAYVDANYTVPLFGVHFTREFLFSDSPGSDGTEYSYIAMNMTSTNAHDVDPTSGSSAVCPGQATTQSCRLRPAVVSYPLQITNYEGAHSLNGIRLGTPQKQGDNSSHVILKQEPYDINLKQQGGFKVLRHADISSYEDSVARLGGLQLAFQTYLGGNASIYFGGAVNLISEIEGGAYKYLLNAEDIESNCGFQWINPIEPGNQTDSLTQSVVSSINEIMLLTNLGIPAIWNTSSAPLAAPTSFNATMYRDAVHYSTNKWYMIGAVISNFICVLCVLPSYWGFWQLGRKVALSPFEIAAAFRSPMVNTGGTIDDILRENGRQPVQFGRIVTGDAAGELGVAEPECVERAHPAIGSAKREINAAVTGVFSKRTTQ